MEDKTKYLGFKTIEFWWRNCWLFLLSFSLSLPYFSQVCSIQSTDIQGNQYWVEHNEIFKKDTKSNNLFRFSNKLIGALHYMDVTNVMRPIFFYKDVQKLVITDNTLSEQSKEVFNLETLGYYQISCVATSKIDNGIWMYDEALLQIVKVDQYFQKTVETGNLKQILNLDNLLPVRMVEANGYLYLQCANNGLLIFDIYGTFYKRIPLEGLEVWNIIEGKILYTTSSGVFIMDQKDFEPEAVCAIETDGLREDLWVDRNNLYTCVAGKTEQVQIEEKTAHFFQH